MNVHKCQNREADWILLYTLFTGKYRADPTVSMNQLRQAFTLGKSDSIVNSLNVGLFSEKVFSYPTEDSNGNPIPAGQVGKSCYFYCLFQNYNLVANDIIPSWSGNILLRIREDDIINAPHAKLLEAFLYYKNKQEKNIGQTHGVIRFVPPEQEDISIGEMLFDFVSYLSNKSIDIKFSEFEDFLPDPRN